MSDDLVEEVCNTIIEWVGDVIDHEHAMSAARAAIACVQRWRPISEAPKDRPIEAWHKVWKCPVTIVYRSSGGRWVEKTLTTEWPLEAFTHWREASEPPE